MADSNYSIRVLFQVLDRATGPLNRIGGSLERLAHKSQRLAKNLDRVGQSMQGIGRGMSAKLTAPLALFGGLAVRAAVNFEGAMNKVGAITRATGPQFESMTALAKQLGATTQFSATQAAEAMQFLGMAGLDTKQVMEALPQTLQLAAAGGMDLAMAADISTNIMTSMSKKASDLSHINDVLALAQSRANTNIEQLAEAFRPVAPIADTLGFSIEHVTAMLGKMADAGERGSIAGTLLRNAMMAVVAPSKHQQAGFDSLGIKLEDYVDKAGKIKNFNGLLAELTAKNATAAQVMTAFGARGGRAVALLLKGGKDIGQFTDELKRSSENGGVAAEMQERMMRGLPGAMKLLSSAFEGLQLALTSGEVGAFINSFVRGLADMLSWMSKLHPNILKVAVVIGALVAVLGPLIFAIGVILPMFGPMMVGIGAVGKGLTFLVPVLKTVILALWGTVKALWGVIVAGGPILWTIMAIAIAALLIWKYWGPISKFFKMLWKNIVVIFEQNRETIMKIIAPFKWFLQPMIDSFKMVYDNWDSVVKYIKIGFNFFRVAFDILTDVVVSPFKAMMIVAQESINFVQKTFFEPFQKWWGEIKEGWGKATAAFQSNASRYDQARAAVDVGSLVNNVSGKLEVGISLKSADGSEASIDKVRKEKGNPDVNIFNNTYLGSSLGSAYPAY